MKRHLMLAAVCLAAMSSAALARNDVATYSIDAALKSEGSDKVGSDIALVFAGQNHAPVAKSMGEIATNKKTNGVGRSDEAACQYVFLSAVLALQERARQMGGNAVINIKSNYKNNLTESATEFTCGSGALMSGVALKGEVVTLKK
ncbi:hypothetical protein [Ralstonia mannitolilytica]|uniref:Excinuclease ABC subunit A n=1 Tax=Ralstonia mannitolilytica TaxID=105219 RepID=A0AAJ4ZQ86_9RALS|nr:hypothetical protein [Ralstonia mannitolilytica]CAG2131741.1 hypothetical protein LMG6866_00798 [Ralstonia mannitolilytica]CAJ0729847.1 hypothetical protein R77592_02138 [Ralstonia mannitolilytica]SUE25046.1 Uncharacterised protein [Ralstonia mannitolilytica]SUE26259.1 Uncharacterised protein [Ralstonia mannitolilytica]SUE36070.1 Uncharacterised protein [Ralstonia mannitolilytica]